MEAKGILLEAKINGLGITRGQTYEVAEAEDHGHFQVLWFYDDENKLSYHIYGGFSPADAFNVYYQIQEYGCSEKPNIIFGCLEHLFSICQVF